MLFACTLSQTQKMFRLLTRFANITGGIICRIFMKWQPTYACKKNDPYLLTIMNAWWTQTAVATESGSDISHTGTTLLKKRSPLISVPFQKKPLIKNPTLNYRASVNKSCLGISSQFQHCIKICADLIHYCLLRSFLLYYKWSTWIKNSFFPERAKRSRYITIELSIHKPPALFRFVSWSIPPQ
jgi:hypothetical protein